ncbi:MAG: hypothetical protein ACYTFY_03300 [Planctomycetota bacterium]
MQKQSSAVFPGNSRKVLFPELPVPEGARSIFSSGGKMQKKGFIYHCSQPLTELSAFYKEKMLAHKWIEDIEAAALLNKTTSMTCLAFENGVFSCFIELESMQKNKGTAVVIQLLRNKSNGFSGDKNDK